MAAKDETGRGVSPADLVLNLLIDQGIRAARSNGGPFTSERRSEISLLETVSQPTRAAEFVRSIHCLG